MPTNVLPASQFRTKLLAFVREAGRLHDRAILTHRGVPQAVVMSYEEYEGWLETLEILSDRGFARGLRKAREEARRGRLLSYEEVFGKPPATRKR
jgi:antitoxin YefM